MRKNIDKIIRKALHESLHEKTEDLTNRIKSKMDEWTPNEPATISNQDSDMSMDEREMCDECGGGYMEEGVCNECGYGGMYEDMDEDIYEDMDEGNAFSGALAKAKESFQLTESEMIDLIEKIVLEQKKAKGMSETEKVLNADKKENDQYIKDVTKKMKDYLKGGSKSEYTMEPKVFPKGNGALEKDEKIKKYTPSDAVDEYVDAFAYPGMTNLVYDEIKPDKKRIEKYIKGHKTTGNAQVDEEGKAYGNVVPSKVGEKFMKNYEDNLYGAEQMTASYKRQPQDVLDVSGEKTQKSGLQKLRSKNANKAKDVMDKVDENKKSENPVLNEEFNKMKHLISYNKKTQ